MVGATADMVLQPYGAAVAGSVAGIIATIGINHHINSINYTIQYLATLKLQLYMVAEEPFKTSPNDTVMRIHVAVVTGRIRDVSLWARMQGR